MRGRPCDPPSRGGSRRGSRTRRATLVASGGLELFPREAARHGDQPPAQCRAAGGTLVGLLGVGRHVLRIREAHVRSPGRVDHSNASDWVRWRALVWTWNGSSWGSPTDYAWTPYSLVNGWYEFPPAQVRCPGGRYYHVQYQAEHYYARQTVTANQVSHFGLGTGIVTSSSTFCAVA